VKRGRAAGHGSATGNPAERRERQCRQVGHTDIGERRLDIGCERRQRRKRNLDATPGARPASGDEAATRRAGEHGGSSVGDSYDNALAETINGLYKAEVIWRRGPWRSMEAVEYATLEWVDWFNNRRLLSSIGDIPPAEAEAAYYASLEEPAAIAA
jgi:Integrase core domain